MKKTLKTILNLMVATALLMFNTLHVSAAGAPGQTRTQMLEQIHAAGDYNIGSVYGPRLNQTELNQVAQAVLTFVESYDWTEMDDFTKVYCAHQYLCDICEYAPDWSKNRANTAWGALVYGEAQCSGYARAFKALCDAIGIGCYYVHADENAVNPSHQWNEVCVDSVWYIIDVQCNDSSGFPAVYLVSGDTYAYCFGMSWNHDGLPECTQDYLYGGEECGRTSQEVLQTSPLTLQDIPMGNGTRETITNDAGEICYVNEYDENGNLIKSIYCNADGTIWAIDEYEEKEKREKTTYYNDNGTIDFSVISEYEYRENWKCEKSTYYNADGTVDFFVVSEYEYEQNWKRNKTTYYNADGTVNFGTLSEAVYDENGNRVESVSYDADGIFQTHEIYEYDESGNKVKNTCYNEDGTLALYVIYEYDGNGNRVKDSYYNANGTMDYYVVSEYDRDGEWLGNTYWNADQTSSMVIGF